MSVYEGVLGKLKLNKERREKGDVIAIPWSLPRISSVLPGIEKGRYNLVSASPKAGKTQFTDFLYVFEPVEWIIKNPLTNISLKIFYFSLEVSSESKIKAAVSYKLFKDYKIAISPQKISSVFKDYVLDDKIEALINGKEFREWFEKFESIVTYYDSIRHPYGIFNVIKSYAEQHGKYTYKELNLQGEDGVYSIRKVRDRYIPDNPDEYVIVIVDHVSLLQPKKGETLHQAIGQYSSEYCLEMRDRWGYIPVIVQQQSADSSKAQFNFRGDTVLEKIKPDLEGLSDNKYTARDCDLMISLFYPARYNLDKHEGVDLKKMGNEHREFMINLNRHGISNASIQLYFLGSSSYFSELPTKLNDKIYEQIKEINQKAY